MTFKKQIQTYINVHYCLILKLNSLTTEALGFLSYESESRIYDIGHMGHPYLSQQTVLSHCRYTAAFQVSLGTYGWKFE